MSVWGTIYEAPADHTDTCAVWVEVAERTRERVRNQACTCGCPAAPIIYRGSHILPSEDSQRGGHVSLAEVPGRITRDGRDDGPDDRYGVWPWLRLSVGQEDAVLDEQLAGSLYRALGDWLTARGNTNLPPSGGTPTDGQPRPQNERLNP